MNKFILTLTLAAIPLIIYASGDPLMEYMWKNRLVVYSISESETGKFDMGKIAEQNSAELKDRDMMFVDLNGKDSGALFIELSSEQSDQLKKAYKIKDDKSVFILVGKDGGEKERLTGILDLQYFFDKIDMMPMRMEEMGER